MIYRGGWYALLCGFLHMNTNIPVLLWNVPSYYFITWRRDVTAQKKVLPENMHAEKQENTHAEKQDNTHAEKHEVVAVVASSFCFKQ